MSVSPKELLEHAAEMPKASEADCRAAISRGYYAAFHTAQLFHDGLSTGGVPPSPPKGMHETLYHRLTNPTVSGQDEKSLSRRLGHIGRDLRKKREDADYHLHLPLNCEDVNYVIQLSRKALELGNQI